MFALGHAPKLDPVSASPRRESILSSFCPFRSFRTSEKNTIRKVSLCIFAGRRGADPYKLKSKCADRQNTKYNSIPSVHKLSRARLPCLGVAETGAEGGTRSVTDEVLF